MLQYDDLIHDRIQYGVSGCPCGDRLQQGVHTGIGMILIEQSIAGSSLGHYGVLQYDEALAISAVPVCSTC